jgi:copper chaperone
MKTLQLYINGMSCGHCLNAVNKALGDLGVTPVSVQIGRAVVEYDEQVIGEEEIYAAVRRAGYDPLVAS